MLRGLARATQAHEGVRLPTRYPPRVLREGWHPAGFVARQSVSDETFERGHVLKRLRYLRNNEALGGTVLWVVLGLWLKRSGTSWLPSVAAMGAVSFILVQGIIYWHLKLVAVRKKSPSLPGYFRGLFVFFKWANMVVIVGAACLVFSQLGAARGVVWRVIPCALLALAVLEHINYYGYQLMHDNRRDWRYLWRNRRLRRSPLALDLAAR